MIAKRVMRPRASSDFARLSTYILGEGHAAKTSAAADRTFDYILADQAGGRVGAVRITNCNADTPSLAIMEILATQSLNKRSRGDRTYHLVVSFEPGERPPPAQIEDIENELCAAIGLLSHQRISAIHLDRAHLHLHIAINKVDPSTLALRRALLRQAQADEGLRPAGDQARPGAHQSWPLRQGRTQGTRRGFRGA